MLLHIYTSHQTILWKEAAFPSIKTPQFLDKFQPKKLKRQSRFLELTLQFCLSFCKSLETQLKSEFHRDAKHFSNIMIRVKYSVTSVNDLIMWVHLVVKIQEIFCNTNTWLEHPASVTSRIRSIWKRGYVAQLVRAQHS